MSLCLAATLYIRCLEQPSVNRSPIGTNLTAEQIALNVLHLVHPYIMYDIPTTLTAHKGTPIQWDDGIREQTITVRAEIKIPRTKACALPVIAVDAEGQRHHHLRDGRRDDLLLHQRELSVPECWHRLRPFQRGRWHASARRGLQPTQPSSE